MSAWIVIAESDLLTRISGPELDAFRSAALADAQADPVAPIVAEITDEVRGYVANCARNTLGDGATIPKKLLGAALDRIVWEIMKRPGASIIDDRNESRAKSNDAAIALFKRVADCGFAIDQPETATTDEISSPSPSFTDKRRRFTRDREEGA